MRAATATFLFFLASPAFAATDAELKEMTATILNLNGHLCARVVEIRPLRIEGQFEVTCIEYRGGSGQVRYILNARAGTAFKAGN
jgi:hypothetical protein